MEKNIIKEILPEKSGISKTGKPYTFYKIKTDKHGDKVLTTFGSAVTAKWKVGDEIEIKVTETRSADGKYTNYNFEYPKVPPMGLELESLKMRVDKIEKFLKLDKPMVGDTGVEYPTPESEGIDINNIF